MKSIFIIATCCALFSACNNDKKDDKTGEVKTVTGMDAKKPASELLDMTNADPVKNALAAFARKDVDAMTADYDDNIRYTWSGGDSAIGKQAVKDYYAGRIKLIDNISFSNEIALPVQVNVSQQPMYAPAGKWVLYWVQTHVKYKNGKELTFWQHSVNHFNTANKIDYIGMYLDKHPIMEATKDLMK
jgi:hypothetical protein